MSNPSRRSWMKKTAGVLGLLFVLWAIGCAVIYSEMRKPPEQFAHFMAKLPGPVAFLAFPFETMWMRARSGSVQLGDLAPDFSLPKLDKSETLHLATINRKQPVVLIFGSYT